MANLNRVFIIGTMGRDPEIRYTPTGKAVCDISLAVNEKWTAENGEKRESTTWVDIVLWGKQAELCGQYVFKGHQLYVEGKLTRDEWEDKATGERRSRMKITGEHIQFLSHKDGERTTGSHGVPQRPPAEERQRQRQQGTNQGTQHQRPPQNRPPARTGQEQGPITDGLDDDDVPF